MTRGVTDFHSDPIPSMVLSIPILIATNTFYKSLMTGEKETKNRLHNYTKTQIIFLWYNFLKNTEKDLNDSGH